MPYSKSNIDVTVKSGLESLKIIGNGTIPLTAYAGFYSSSIVTIRVWLLPFSKISEILVKNAKFSHLHSSTRSRRTPIFFFQNINTTCPSPWAVRRCKNNMPSDCHDVTTVLCGSLVCWLEKSCIYVKHIMLTRFKQVTLASANY